MKIKDLLTDESKWLQGSHRDGTPCCLERAVEVCYGDNKTLEQDIKSRIDKYLGGDGSVNMRIIYWNDAPERTFADIRRLIEELDI